MISELDEMAEIFSDSDGMDTKLTTFSLDVNTKQKHLGLNKL